MATDHDAARDAEALATWRRHVAALYEVRVPASREANFRVAGTTWQLPHGFLSSARGTGLTLLRSPERVAKSPIDVLSVFRLRKGRVSADYDGRSVKLGPGDLVMIDYARPVRSRTSAFAAEAVLVPRAFMPARAQGGGHHGIVLAAATPAARLLGRQMDSLFDALDTLSVAQAQAALDAFVGLAVALWPLGAIDDPALALLDRAKALIRDAIGDPALNVVGIATRLRVSRAALYAAFAAEGGISAFVQRTRLDEALKAFVAEPSRHGIVQETAKRFGFKSLAHFSRAFQRRFGCTPSEAQELGSRSVGGRRFSEWLMAHGAALNSDLIRDWMKGANDASDRGGR